DETRAEEIHSVRLRDVPVERCRVELREHEDAPDVGVQAIADRNVDQAVFAADRNCGFRPMLCERKEPRALTAAENQCENFVVHGARGKRKYRRICYNSPVLALTDGPVEDPIWPSA